MTSERHESVLTESVRNGRRLINLLETREEDLTTFSNSIRTRSGFLQILVHPFFNEDFKCGDALYEEYKTKRNRFISSCIKYGIPLVIFEEEDNLNSLPKRLSKGTSGDVFIVVTDTLSPRPNENHRMDFMVQVFRETGVKKISVGGQLMWFVRVDDSAGGLWPAWAKRLREYEQVSGMICKWFDKNTLPAGCAGVLAEVLYLEGFEIILSPISYPQYNMRRPSDK